MTLSKAVQASRAAALAAADAEPRYTHHPHPRTVSREHSGPTRVADHHPRHSPVARFNTRVALAVTRAVGSMWCAYLFGLFDLISLPEAIRGGSATIVSWIAQTFLQLVLLSVIMVGQNVQAEASDRRADATWHDASAALHEIAELQRHLLAQDQHLVEQDQHLHAQDAVLARLVTAQPKLATPRAPRKATPVG